MTGHLIWGHLIWGQPACFPISLDGAARFFIPLQTREEEKQERQSNKLLRFSVRDAVMCLFASVA